MYTYLQASGRMEVEEAEQHRVERFRHYARQRLSRGGQVSSTARSPCSPSTTNALQPRTLTIAAQADGRGARSSSFRGVTTRVEMRGRARMGRATRPRGRSSRGTSTPRLCLRTHSWCRRRGERTGCCRCDSSPLTQFPPSHLTCQAFCSCSESRTGPLAGVRLPCAGPLAFAAGGPRRWPRRRQPARPASSARDARGHAHLHAVRGGAGRAGAGPARAAPGDRPAVVPGGSRRARPGAWRARHRHRGAAPLGPGHGRRSEPGKRAPVHVLRLLRRARGAGRRLCGPRRSGCRRGGGSRGSGRRDADEVGWVDRVCSPGDEAIRRGDATAGAARSDVPTGVQVSRRKFLSAVHKSLPAAHPNMIVEWKFSKCAACDNSQGHELRIEQHGEGVGAGGRRCGGCWCTSRKTADGASGSLRLCQVALDQNDWHGSMRCEKLTRALFSGAQTNAGPERSLSRIGRLPVAPGGLEPASAASQNGRI